MSTKPTSEAAALAETPDTYGAFPRLDDAQLAALAAFGDARVTDPGVPLFTDGQRNCDFYAVLDGLVASVEGYQTPAERVLAVHGRGRFLGELGLLTGEAAFFSAVPAEPGRVLVVPVDRLRELVASNPTIGDLVLRAFLIRRSILIGLGVGMRIVGSRFSPDARRLREFAARNRVPAQWLDLEGDPDAEALLRLIEVDPGQTPIVILYGRQLLRNPSNAEVAAAIGLPAPTVPQAACELLVVGAGPAGLSAAVYAASEGLDTLVLDSTATGGQAGTSSCIENYLGFPSGLSGSELAVRAELQARKFGARFAVPAEAVSTELDYGHWTVRLADGSSVTTRLMVIASGARYRRPDVPRLEHFEPTSVYYAASQAEAVACADDQVVVLGGGNSAGQAAIFLAEHAADVIVVASEDDLSEHMSRYLVDRISSTPNVTVLLRTQVRELIGDLTLEAVAVTAQTGERQLIATKALFVFIGATPATQWLSGLLALDENGFVRTGQDAEAPIGASLPHTLWRRSALETSQPGAFAVGDVRSGSTKRVATAVGDGAMAVRLALERA
ncbi:MAG TPA: FAD-dependent oxidoreductase [Streptosporangiaceae bacterium]|nr:FAD-dependent oxidoreductase [Streptosporangiaceae bacterium]